MMRKLTVQFSELSDREKISLDTFTRRITSHFGGLGKGITDRLFVVLGGLEGFLGFEVMLYGYASFFLMVVAAF